MDRQAALRDSPAAERISGGWLSPWRPAARFPVDTVTRTCPAFSPASTPMVRRRAMPPISRA